MTKQYVLLILMFIPLFSFCQVYQTGTIKPKNGSAVKERVFINYDNEIIQWKKGKIPFRDVESFQIDDRIYTRTQIGKEGFFAFNLVSGNASLYDIAGNRYLVKSKNGVLKIIDLNNEKGKNIGTLSILLGDCNELRDFLWSQTTFDEEVLLSSINKYNSCKYGSFELTEKEKANSNRDEKMSFYLGAGYGFNNIKFSEDANTQNMPSIQIHIGMLGFPRFSSKENNKFAISGELISSFGTQTDFQNTFLTRDIKINSIRLLVGAEYYFFSSKKINPFIGINGGLSSDTYKGIITRVIIDEPIAPLEKLKETRINAVFGFKAGLRFSTGSNHISVLANYFPERKKEVQEGLNRRLTVFRSTLALGVNYYF